MALPSTYRAFRRTTGAWPHTIEVVNEKLPQPDQLGPKDVLIKIHAVSLNYRDIAMLVEGVYPLDFTEGGIPSSDCAAEAVAVGSDVKEFKVGDRVAPNFDLTNITGVEEDASHAGLGGNVEGVLREYAVFEENVLVHLPAHLSWEEASTIPCAGVTAWNALKMPVFASGPNASALLQGTGGVSMFALLICIAAGIKPIISSSSDQKLASIKKLSHTILGYNYKTNPDQASEVNRLTDGKGVGVVIKNTGPGSLPADIASLRRRRGQVSMIGFLDGWKADWDQTGLILSLKAKEAALQGISVGSKRDFQDLNNFLEEKKVSLKPLIDRVFSFEEGKAAFEYLRSGKHVGKIIIQMPC